MSLHLRNYGKLTGPPPNQQLQFLKTTTLAQTLKVKKYGNNRATQKEKAQLYILPSVNQGKVSVSIIEDDLRSQVEYWKYALIGYVIGDTPM